MGSLSCVKETLISRIQVKSNKIIRGKKLIIDNDDHITKYMYLIQGHPNCAFEPKVFDYMEVIQQLETWTRRI